jgi:hypothetical protein
MLNPADQIARLEHCVRTQMAEIDRLRALIDRKDADLDTLVAWIAGDADALGCLQAVYADPRSTSANKVKAAASAIAYERSKPAAFVVQVDFRERVRAARMKQLELDKAEWARQAAEIPREDSAQISPGFGAGNS